MPGASCFSTRRVGRQSPHGCLAHAVICPQQKEHRPRARRRISRQKPQSLKSDAAVTVDTKLTVKAQRVRPARPPADRPCRARRALKLRPPAARGRGTRRAWLTTDPGRGASVNCADAAARGSRRPPQPARTARPTSPENAGASRPWPLTEAQAGRIATQAARGTMVAKTWTSQPRRAPCPRRFVIIYRRRQPEGHGGTDAPWSDVMIFPVSQTLRQSHRAAAWR